MLSGYAVGADSISARDDSVGAIQESPAVIVGVLCEETVSVLFFDTVGAKKMNQ